MRLYTGTSGFSYPAWVGSFYPEDLPEDRWLHHYAGKLRAVEINNSFYRVPRSSVIESWRDAVDDDFRIVLKASRRVTHFARLKETADEAMHWVWRAAQKLDSKRGPLLFQLPPNMMADVERLDAFLGRQPDELRAAFEFRHPSWLEPGAADEVRAVLTARGAALCIADDGKSDVEPNLAPTAPFAYLRLRRPEYDDVVLEGWAAALAQAELDEAFVFFKHEDAGAGPALAARFAALVAERSA